MVVTPEPADWREKGYETVAIPENPECKIPWVRMTVIRKSPDGNELVLEAHVLPKKWLHEHPETIDKIERSSIRPSPDEPVGVERREGTQSLDDGSDLDKEQVRKHKGGILTHQTPAVDGEIEPHRISKAVFSRATQLKACYEAALARNLPRKSLVQIHWKVTTKGRATNVEIEEDNVGDPRLLQCLRHEIAQTSFPAEKGGPTDVVFHFIYDVGGDP